MGIQNEKPTFYSLFTSATLCNAGNSYCPVSLSVSIYVCHKSCSIERDARVDLFFVK